MLDAHADIEIAGKPSPYAGEDGLSQVEPAKLAAGSVDAVVMSVAVGPGPRNLEGYATARATADEEEGSRRRTKNVEFIEYEWVEHSIFNEEYRIDIFERIGAFLEENLTPREPAS